MASGADAKLIDRARAIVRSGIIEPMDVQTVLAAARVLVQNSRDLMQEDHRIMTAAGNISPGYDRPPRRPPPTPFDGDLAEAQAALVGERQKLDEATAATYHAAAALEQRLGSGTVVLAGGKKIIPVREPGGQVTNATPAEIAQAQRVADDALTAELRQLEHWHAARARVGHLEQAQGRWRATLPEK